MKSKVNEGEALTEARSESRLHNSRLEVAWSKLAAYIEKCNFGSREAARGEET